MGDKYNAESDHELTHLRLRARWRHQLRTTNLAEGFLPSFRHVRNCLTRFAGRAVAEHIEKALNRLLLLWERAHG